MSNRSPAKNRVQKDIHRLLTILMQREINDPKLFGIAVTRIEPSRGGQELTVYVHRMDSVDHAGLVHSLNRMRPHFEHEIRQALPKRRLPGISFKWDDVFDKSGVVLDLLNKIGQD